jgi:hypothetical protein
MCELWTPLGAMDSTARRLGWSSEAQSPARSAAKRVDIIQAEDRCARERALAGFSAE